MFTYFISTAYHERVRVYLKAEILSYSAWLKNVALFDHVVTRRTKTVRLTKDFVTIYVRIAALNRREFFKVDPKNVWINYVLKLVDNLF